MKNETEVVKIRIDKDVKKALEKASTTECRTFMDQVRYVLREWALKQ